jgi:sulfite exporter TauE/SafE
MTAFLAGLAFGVAGSGHCAAMCGPLVLTFGRRRSAPSQWAQAQHALLYQAGRVLTYLALAVPAGLAGQALMVHGLGRALALAAGILLLFAAAGSARILGRLASGCAGLVARVAGPAHRWAAARPVAGPLLTGALNGLLPCGLVYAAVAMAAATGDLGDALLVMSGFGVGTTPVLLAISLWSAALPLTLRARLRHLTPVVLALTAVLLIARGLMTGGGGVAHH